MSQALQSAQQSLQQAGQQSAQNGQQQGGQQGEATQAQMGQEFQPGSQGGAQSQGQSGQQASSQSGQNGKGSQSGKPSSGGGLGNAGIGVGGNVGPQQPLPGVKKNQLVRGAVNEKGQKLSRSYMGTPDPTQDRAAYYSVVPEKVRAAEESLNREDIPAGYKKQVRDYFEAIQPR